MSLINKTRIQELIMIVLGGLLLIITKVKGDALEYSNLIFGLGIGFFAGGVGALVGSIFTKGKREGNYKIQENDERLHYYYNMKL